MHWRQKQLFNAETVVLTLVSWFIRHSSHNILTKYNGANWKSVINQLCTIKRIVIIG